ncbi:MAG: WD40 repeat domain-containing serine/threonine-protein kinase [Prosthecobacter sp.]
MNHLCPECHTPLPDGRLEGVCPACFFDSVSEGDAMTGLQRGAEIARGGMGIVYEAQQAEPKRSVALKMMRPQWAENEQARERFRREARAMASLEHPAILPVYDVGESDGLPWFTMKLASGGSLATHVSDFSGKWHRIAELMARAARALSFAHERGVLHRDVKPGNILFDAEGGCYLADFGLAKHLVIEADDLSLTLDAGVLGTPNYLAPELASGESHTATTASDIYSLGAVLYELLTGTPPYQDSSLAALLRRVADEMPRPLADFQTPHDLRAICEKAMSREPDQRYATARELAEDLERFQRGASVLARQPGYAESIWRWCRRHPAVAALLGIVFALLATIAIGSTLAVVRISKAEREAVAARDRAEANARRSTLASAEGLRRARQPRFRDHALQRVIDAAAPNEDEEMRVDRRSEAIANLAFPMLHEHDAPKTDPGWKLATVSSGQEFHAWRGKESWRVTNGRNGAVVSQSSQHSQPLCLSRNGQWLAAQSPDGRGWQLWDLTQHEARLEATLSGQPEDLSDDGALIAYYHPGTAGTIIAEVRETRGGRLRFELPFPQVSLKMRFNAEATLCAIAPSSYLNDSDFPYSVKLHRTTDGSIERELTEGMTNCIWSMAWSRDGKLLAASERGGAAVIWNTHTSHPRQLLRGTGSDMWLMAFSEDGRRLATVSDDRLMSVIDVMSGLPMGRGYEWIPHGVPQMAWSAAEPDVFGPISADEKNMYARVDAGAFDTFSAPDSNGRVLGIAISPDSRWLVTGDSRHARLWDRQQQKAPHIFTNGLWNDFAFSPDGHWLYGAGEPGVVRWEMDAQGVQETSRHELLPAGRHNALALDASGTLLAAESADTGQLSLFQSPSTKPIRRDIARANNGAWLALTQDGGLVVAASRSGVEVWRTKTGEQVHQQKKPALWAAFSPDGQWLVLGRDRYEMWRTSDWSLAHTLDMRSINPEQARFTFSADGHWLATGHSFGKISLWSVPDWKRFAILESPNSQPVGRFTFTRDASQLYIASTSGVIETWDLKRLDEELRKLGLEW